MGAFDMRFTLAPLIALALAVPLASAMADAYTFSTLTIPAASPLSVFGTIARGINNVGQVVGSYGTDNGGFNGEQGFVLNLATGTATTLSSPGSTAPMLAERINDAGQIIGHFTVGSGFETQQGGPFLFDPATGTFTNIFYPSYPYNFTPTAINNSGQLLGDLSGGGGSSRNGPFYSQGYLRNLTTGASITFADPLAPNYTGASSLNDHGQVVGYFQVGSTPSGFLYDVATGSYTTLNDPSGNQTYAMTINNVGQVGGYFDSAFIDSGYVLDLATGVYTTVTYPGASDTYVESINDAGQIVGYYRNTDYSLHAFLATPTVAVAEPATLALLGSVVLVFGCTRHRRRQ